jgi:hypothetical protein
MAAAGAAERPFDPGEQLIDLPAVVASHDNVKAVHSLTSTRLQAARPPGGYFAQMRLSRGEPW